MTLVRALGRFMVDTAAVYGVEPATDAYTILIVGPFMCRLLQRNEASLGTGIGPVRTKYYHAYYPSSVTLPAGYWEIEVAGARYTPRANSDRVYRDLGGTILLRGIDLDLIGAVPA